MPDVASLSFDIDSSQAQRAIGVLETLKATSISVTQATNQFNTANQTLTQTYGQERDALAKLADQTKAYDGTLGGLVNKLNELRRGITGTTADFRAYAQVLSTATAAAVQFNNSVEGLDRYVTKAKELRVTTQDLATSFQRMTDALRNQTVEGNQTRVMLQQLGVGLSDLKPQQADVVLQRLADQLRQFRDSQQKIQAAQQILGPSFDAQQVLALENQPYQPFRQRQAQERTVAAQAQIDAQQAAIQRATIQLRRNEAERTDRNSQYTLSPGFFGRVGLNPFAGSELSRDQQLARLRQIDQLPPEQRRQYEGYGYQFGQAVEAAASGRPVNANTTGLNLPLRTAAGLAGDVVGIARNFSSGTWSSNQQEIWLRAQQEANASSLGYLGAAPAFLGRSAANLTHGYTAQIPEDQRPQSALERLMLQREAARVVGSYGDPSLANQIQLKDQLAAFTAPGAKRGLPGLDDVKALPDISAVQQKYIDVLGQGEGTRRYTAQLQNIQQQTLYAQQPERETQANTDREQYILSLPAEQRQQARFQLQYQRQLYGPAGDLASPGAGNAGQALLNQQQRQTGTTAFNAQVSGGLQERQEDNQRQLEFQKDLATSLDHGRAAAEDFTRAWQEYTQVKLQGATQDQADLTALNALNLALAQRVTQGKALVAQLHEENTLTANQLAATAGTVGADVQTRRGAEISSRIAADRDRLINAGQLPDPHGGQWTDPKTGKTVTLTAPGAKQVIDQYTQERQTEVGQQGVGGARDVTNAVADQARDAQRVVDIMRDQNVSMERAQSLLQTEKALREAIAKAEADKLGHSKEQLEVEQQNTAEMQRQAAISANAAQNLQTANDVNLQNQYERAINALPLNQQGPARAALPAILRAQQARQGGAGNLVGLRPPGQDTGFQNFNAPEDSVAAGIRQLQTNQDTHHLSTIRQQITRWAPPSDPRNNTEGYIQRVAKETGLDPDAPLNTHDQAIVQKVITAIVGVETGRAPDANVIARGVTQAFTPGAAGSPGTTMRSAAGGGPTNLPGAANTELDAATRALTEQFRVGQETTNIQQQGQFNARQAVDRQRLQLIAQGRTGEAERLQPVDPSLPPDLQQADVQRRTAGVVSGQQSRAVGDMQQTRQATADLTRETEALNKGLDGGAVALRELDARLQAHNEALRAGPGIIDENKRAQDLLNKSLAEAGKQLAANTMEQEKSQEVQKALNAAGPFASDLELAKVRRDTELQRRFKDQPGLEQSPEGQQAIEANKAQDQLDESTRSMGEYRDAAREASSAIANSFQAVATGAETGKQAALGLAKTLESIAIKVLVTQPFEHMLQGLFGGGGDNKDGQGSGGSGGGGGGSSGGIFSGIGNFFGKLFGGGGSGGGGSGAAASTDTPGAAAGSDSGGGFFSGIGNWFSKVFGGGSTAATDTSGAAARGDGSGSGGASSSSGTAAADVQTAANDNGGTGVAANDNSPGIFATAAKSVSNAASGSSSSSGGLFSQIANHAGGIFGFLTDKVGGEGFYQGGGLIGSLFGTAGKGYGDNAGSLTSGSTSASDLVSQPGVLQPLDSGTWDAPADSALGDVAANARGGVYGGSKALRAYENTIVEAPTMFRFAAGGVGMMGESGPEAILPLKRGADGKLGISSNQVQHTSGPTVHNWHITTPSPDAFMSSRRQLESKIGASMGKTTTRNST